MTTLRRIGRDLRDRRHVDVYVVSAVSVVVAALSLVGDLVPEGFRWSVVLAALTLLTYQLAVPDRAGDPDSVLHTRAVFEEVPVLSRVKGAREVWVYGPSAVNLLSGDLVDALRRDVLSRPDGRVRVVVLDPTETAAAAIAARQLDGATDFQNIDLLAALKVTTGRLELMARWDVAGTFEYRLAPFNPGFSIVAFDPDARHGVVIVEVHGLRNESTGSRMHIELTRARSEHWHAYWRAQFERLWADARPPA